MDATNTTTKNETKATLLCKLNELHARMEVATLVNAPEPPDQRDPPPPPGAPGLRPPALGTGTTGHRGARPRQRTNAVRFPTATTGDRP